jgi:hypothetical protein
MTSCINNTAVQMKSCELTSLSQENFLATEMMTCIKSLRTVDHTLERSSGEN